MTQTELVLNHMLTGNEINQRIAERQYGIGRLASRICDICEMGYPVKRELRSVQKSNGEQARVTFYWFDKEMLDDWKKGRAD